MRPALHCEWTKLRTVAGPSWLLLATVSLTVALSAFAAASARHAQAGPGLDLTRLSLTGIYLGQAIVAILGVVTIGSEYAFGVIRITLAAVPGRWTVLAAKAVVVGGLARPGSSPCSAPCSPGGSSCPVMASQWHTVTRSCP